MGTTKQVAGLTGACSGKASEASAVSPSLKAGAYRSIHAMAGANFNSRWYRPERLMSQSERLPS
jgi:hypothetical protein